MSRGGAIATTIALGTALATGAATAASPEDEELARALVQEGKSAFAEKDYEDAAEAFDLAYTLHPAPELLFNLGQCYRKLGERQRASEAFRRFLDRRPESALAESVRGTIRDLEEPRSTEESGTVKPSSATSTTVITLAPAIFDDQLILRGDPILGGEGVTTPDDGGVLGAWWFWTAVGVVAVGAGATTAFVLAKDDAESPSLGVIDVR